MLSETVRQLADAFDDALSDPLVAIEANTRQTRQLGDRVRPHSLQRVHQARAEAQRLQRSHLGHAVEVFRQSAAFVAVGGQVDRLEATEPGAAHLLGVVESFAVVPRQRGPKERGQRLPDRRIKQLGVEGHFVVRQCGVTEPITPAGKLPGRHLVKRHGGSEPLCVRVPSRRRAQRQERIPVLRRARADVSGRRVREGRSRIP